MSEDALDGFVLVVGVEPAALSCCLELVEAGLPVRHVYPVPVGLRGSSRDIGLAYPELGEPFERVAHAIGEELATEYHHWSKLGVEDLEKRLPERVSRGSRMAVTRTEQESKLLSADALHRSKPPLNDQVRLMSGVAVSNYVPVHAADMGSFETHAVTFAPVSVLNALLDQLKTNELYQSFEIEDDWGSCKMSWAESGVQFLGPKSLLVQGDVAVVGAGMDTGRLLGRLQDVLVPVLGHAFRSNPLPESFRSSVVGVTASWGYERYRFDPERRLLGCGVDPSGSGGQGTNVDEKVMKAVLKRASQLFVDFDDSDLEQVMRWAVEFDGTCDGLPIMGPLTGESKVQVVCGFGLSAWSRGWEAGRRLARAVSGGEVGGFLKRCRPRRFVRA